MSSFVINVQGVYAEVGLVAMIVTVMKILFYNAFKLAIRTQKRNFLEKQNLNHPFINLI